MNNQSHFPELEYAEERFTELKCAEAEFRGREFYDCVFVNCTFSEATFYACKFDECIFQECDLRLMKVTDSIFINVQFQKCQAIGVDWTVADWSRIGLAEPLNFTECAISHSSFMGIPLKKSLLKKCEAENADFAEADLSEADCTETNFLSARFTQTNLAKTNFEDAINYAIDVHQNTLTKTKFSMPEAISLLDSLDIIVKD
ncbi:MAG: pentapeptide repeat-containing protein [Chloroflexota bacterium]